MAKEKCDRNCATCNAENRSFCAVQMAMANQEILLSLSKTINELAEMSKSNTQLISPVDISEPTDLGAETKDE